MLYTLPSLSYVCPSSHSAWASCTIVMRRSAQHSCVVIDLTPYHQLLAWFLDVGSQCSLLAASQRGVLLCRFLIRHSQRPLSASSMLSCPFSSALYCRACPERRWQQALSQHLQVCIALLTWFASNVHKFFTCQWPMTKCAIGETRMLLFISTFNPGTKAVKEQGTDLHKELTCRRRANIQLHTRI